MADNEKSVVISRDGESLKVVPDRVVLQFKKHEQAVWSCEDGDFTITFDRAKNPDTVDVSPFNVHKFNGGPKKPQPSGPIKLKKKDVYSYTVSVTLADGSGTLVKDPDVAIDDGGEPRARQERKVVHKSKTGAKKRKVVAKKRKVATRKRKVATRKPKSGARRSRKKGGRG